MQRRPQEKSKTNSTWSQHSILVYAWKHIPLFGMTLWNMKTTSSSLARSTSHVRTWICWARKWAGQVSRTSCWKRDWSDPALSKAYFQGNTTTVHWTATRPCWNVWKGFFWRSMSSVLAKTKWWLHYQRIPGRLWRTWRLPRQATPWRKHRRILQSWRTSKASEVSVVKWEPEIWARLVSCGCPTSIMSGWCWPSFMPSNTTTFCCMLTAWVQWQTSSLLLEVKITRDIWHTSQLSLQTSKSPILVQLTWSREVR